MERREAGMEQAGGETKGSSGTQGRRPRAADVSSHVCVQHRARGKWECESKAGRVGLAAPLGSS